MNGQALDVVAAIIALAMVYLLVRPQSKAALLVVALSDLASNLIRTATTGVAGPAGG